MYETPEIGFNSDFFNIRLRMKNRNEGWTN